MSSSMLLVVLFIVALYFVARLLMFRKTGQRVIANAVAVSLVISFVLGGATYAFLFAPATRLAAQSEMTANPGLPVGPRVVNEGARMNTVSLARLSPVNAPAALGHIDLISVHGAVDSHLLKGDEAIVIGWAAEPSETLAEGLIFFIDAKRYDMTPWYGVDRPDVAAAIGSPELDRAGFQVPLPLDNLTYGRHRLTVWVLAQDRKRIYGVGQSADFVLSR